MLINGQPTFDRNCWREDLHVAGQHHQIDVAAQQIELTLFGLCPNVFRRRDMKEWHAEGPNLIGEVGMVGDHHRHRHVELTASVAPQQIQQAVILFRGQDRDAFGLGRLGQPEVHVEPAGNLLGEIAFERVARRRQPRQMKYRPLHEGAAGLLGGVLIQRNDVGARRRQETAHRRDQTRAVGAPQQQPTDVLGRHGLRGPARGYSPVSASTSIRAWTSPQPLPSWVRQIRTSFRVSLRRSASTDWVEKLSWIAAPSVIHARCLPGEATGYDPPPIFTAT